MLGVPFVAGIVVCLHHRFPSAEGFPGACALDGDECFLPEESLAVRKIQRENPQMFTFGIRKHDTHDVGVHHPPHAGGDSAQQFPQFEVGNNLIGQLQKQFQPLLRALRDIKVDSSINRQCHLVCNQ